MSKQFHFNFYIHVFFSYSTSFLYCLIIIIYCDNQKTITLAKNLNNYSRIKHIEIQQYFVREKIVENVTSIHQMLLDAMMRKCYYSTR